MDYITNELAKYNKKLEKAEEMQRLGIEDEDELEEYIEDQKDAYYETLYEKLDD